MGAARVKVTPEIIEAVKNNELSVRKMSELIGLSQSKTHELIKIHKGEDYVFKPKIKPKPKVVKKPKKLKKPTRETESIFEAEKRLFEAGKKMKGINELDEKEKIKNGSHKWEVGPNRSMILKKIK